MCVFWNLERKTDVYNICIVSIGRSHRMYLNVLNDELVLGML